MKKKIILYSIAVVVVLALLVSSILYYRSVTQKLNDAQPLPASSQEAVVETKNQKLPFDAHFENDKGEQVSLSSFQGKVTVVNLWATWCGFCVQEMPEFYKLYNEYKNNPHVAFVFVDLLDGQQETQERVQEFLQKNHYEDLPVYYDKNSQMFNQLGLRGVPDTFVVNPDGEVVPFGQNFNGTSYYIYPGRMNFDQLKSVLKRELEKVEKK